jgi:hypothetical protein
LQKVLDVVPGRARLHGDRPGGFVEHDAVEGAHVQHDAAFAKGLSAHAVTNAGAGHAKLVIAREGERLCDVVD